MTDSEKKEWQYFEQTAIIGSHKQKTMYIDKGLRFRNTIPAPRFTAVQVWCFKKIQHLPCLCVLM
jgi:hypothetical protein